MKLLFTIHHKVMYQRDLRVVGPLTMTLLHIYY